MVSDADKATHSAGVGVSVCTTQLLNFDFRRSTAGCLRLSIMSNAPIAGVGPDAFSEKKRDDAQDDVEAGSTRIEPALPLYSQDDEEGGISSDEKNGSEEANPSEEINYHTLTWWYVRPPPEQ